MCQVRGTWKSHDLCFRSPSIGLLDKKYVVVKGIRYDGVQLSPKDQLVALGYGGSAMPLECACAESFASLQRQKTSSFFSVASEQPGFLKLRFYLQGEWEMPLGFFSKLFCHHSLTSLAGCFREVVGAIR